MDDEKIKSAILTLEVLIDCCKEDGTTYNAIKEWEALEVFKQLQQERDKYKSIVESLYVCLINEYKCYDCEDKEWKFADDIIKRIETLKKYYFKELEEGRKND